jgi:hypothetical protein
VPGENEGRGKGGKLRRKWGEKGPTRVGTTIEAISQFLQVLLRFPVYYRVIICSGSSLN